MNNKTSDELKILIHNITYLRKKYGISKKKMSELLGIGIKSLNKIEKGEVPPRLSANVIFNIWRYFHIRPKDLLGGKLDEI